MEHPVLVPATTTRIDGGLQEGRAGVLGSARASMASSQPHVLVFPFPVQGHINCLLHFATGLAAGGLHVTFLHTDHNLRRLLELTPAAADSPRLRFLSVPDGLPDGHPRSMRAIGDLMDSLRTNCSVAYRALLASLRADSDGFPPVTCVVADGLLPFGVDVPEELGVPAIAFRTASACSFLAYLSVPKLLEHGHLPFPDGGGGDLDELVPGVPGTEGFLRRRDLPSQCRNLTAAHDDPLLQTVVAVTARTGAARALVLNTAASLEPSALAQIAPRMRDVFAVGPLHAMSPAEPAAASLWREDGGCVAWLDGQEDRSVVYVSFGSLAVITRRQLEELLAGLVATGYPFLWVLRPDAVEASGDGDAEDGAGEAIREEASGGGRARFVAWAPQREVLRHRAVGCFLTHAGWNSTLEAAVEGVPMVCWPLHVDQYINSRFVGAVWRNGLDMKDVCDRGVVESMVREAMESAGIRRSAQALAEQLRRDTAEGGSSAAEFQRLLWFIKELSASPQPCAPSASLGSKSDNPQW